MHNKLLFSFIKYSIFQYLRRSLFSMDLIAELVNSILLKLMSIFNTVQVFSQLTEICCSHLLEVARTTPRAWIQESRLCCTGTMKQVTLLYPWIVYLLKKSIPFQIYKDKIFDAFYKYPSMGKYWKWLFIKLKRTRLKN